MDSTGCRTIIPIVLSTGEPPSVCNVRNGKNNNRGNKVKLTFIAVATVVLLALSILGLGLYLFFKNDPNITVPNITRTIAVNHIVSCPGFNVQTTATGVNVICPFGYTTDRGSYALNIAASCPAANNYRFCNRCTSAVVNYSYSSAVVNYSYAPPSSRELEWDLSLFRTKHFTLKGWHETIHYACYYVRRGSTKKCIVEPRELPVTCQ